MNSVNKDGIFEYGDYVFFMRGPLGNWWKSDITYKGKHFFSSEQLFMYMKAELFFDDETAKEILNCKTSREAKELGRKVKNFNQATWDSTKLNIMTDALMCKYDYDIEFRNIINRYGERKHYVECNPEDSVWAIGMAITNEDIKNPKKWKGENYLGKCLDTIFSRCTPGC